MKKYLTIEQMEKLLQCKRAKIMALVKEGMPHFMIRGSYRFEVNSVDDWLQSEERRG